jgi:N-methylhydantoinase B
MTRPPAFDPITLEVLRGAFDVVADEMELVLLRSSHSTIINEALDATCAIFDAKGRTVAQAVSLPVHLGVLVEVGKRLAAHYPEGEASKGDLYVFNDPYAGGTHLPDIAVAAPVLHDGALAGYVATMSHHSDVGGSAPGSVAPNPVDHLAEGLRLPLVRLATGGETNTDVIEIIEANTRTPAAMRGDLAAQMSACHLGAERFESIVERWGRKTVDSAIEALMDHAETLTRAEIAKIPDGNYEFTDWLDGSGGYPPSEPLPFTVTVGVSGSDIHFDFTGTAPQVPTSFNNVPASTLSACYFVVRTLAGDRAPNNDGCYRPITAHLPKGTIVNPDFPAPVAARSTGLLRVSSAVQGAMVLAAPERFNAANCGQTSLLPVGGHDPEKGEDFVGVIGGPWRGGLGARPGKDGIDVTDTDMSNVYHVPIEATEALLPLRFNRLSLWPDSGGAGKWRGGLGYEAEIEWLRGHGLVSLRRDRHVIPPWGTNGGLDGPVSHTAVRRADGTTEQLPSKGMLYLEAGDVLMLKTTGSGGYGSPLERDPTVVLEDVLDGRVSVDAARELYGVVVVDSAVSLEATQKTRRSLGARSYDDPTEGTR